MIKVAEISKSFGTERVLKDVSFTLGEGELMSVLGASGSGKSTLLKIFSGILGADKGSIKVDGKEILTLPANKRNVVYLGQYPNLFPHLSVAENLGFGLKIRKIGNISEIVKKMAETLQVETLISKMPHELSGGQKQRVAFGRALLVNPSVLLLDEPFSSLDVTLRSSMQDFFLELAEQYAITGLFVTHDIKEALIIGNRVARLDSGEIKLYPEKKDVLKDPATGAIKEAAFWQNQFNSDEFKI